MSEADTASAERRFHAAVKGQAEARAESDIQGYLGYCLPEAMAQLRSQMGQAGGRPNLSALGLIEGFEVLEATTDGETGASSVRYSGYGSFVLKQEWKRTEAGWRVSKIERPPELATGPSLLQRIQRIPNFFSSVRMSRPPGGMPRR